jgi:hypothetical protein
VKHYHKNPRQITKKQFADLQDSLKRLGDLSGIVHDLSTDEIIGGNQRMDVFDLKTAQITLDEKFDQPDEQGTVARGFVIWQGKKYSYRAVMWDDETREEANIRANKSGGSWNFDVLANEFEMPDLIDWGFNEIELGIAPKDDEWGDAMDGLPDEDRAPFQQMTFTMHDTQAETVKGALAAAKAMGAFIDSQNENSNGNALARICEMFLEANGNS